MHCDRIVFHLKSELEWNLQEKPQVLKFQAERMGFKEYPRRLLNRQLAALKALADKGDTNAQAVYQILFEAWSPTTGGEE